MERKRIIGELAQGDPSSKHWNLDSNSTAHTEFIVKPWNGKSPKSMRTYLFANQ